jgi:hypothetical protein
MRINAREVEGIGPSKEDQQQEQERRLARGKQRHHRDGGSAEDRAKELIPMLSDSLLTLSAPLTFEGIELKGSETRCSRKSGNRDLYRQVLQAGRATEDWERRRRTCSFPSSMAVDRRPPRTCWRVENGLWSLYTSNYTNALTAHNCIPCSHLAG